MKISQLRHLCEAIKYGSITIASEENYLSQSAFSASISNLEQELGADLLNRTNKGVTPTHIGEEIFQKCQQIFKLTDDIRYIAKQASHTIDLHIATMPSLIDSLLTDILIDLENAEHPLNLDIVTDDSLVIVQMVQSGIADIGLIFGEPPALSSAISYEHLFNDRYVLFVGESHPLYRQDSLTMTAALKEKHIAYQTEYIKQDNYLTTLVSKYGHPNISLRVDNNESMHRIIARSHYVAFFPEMLVRHNAYIESGKIKALPIIDHDLIIKIGYIYSNHFSNNQQKHFLLKEIKTLVKNRH